MGFTMIDLFAGIGGGAIGFRHRGFTVVAAVEIDPAAAQAYGANVGIQPLPDDVRDVSGEKLLQSAHLRREECTVLFGCPPCQSFTVLRRSSPESEVDKVRNTLPGEWVRLVGEVLPRHVVFENVPGLLSKRWRPQFDHLLAELDRLRYEYDWALLDAADYGAPQVRRRLVLVGSRVAKPKLPSRTHGDPRSEDVRNGVLKPWRTVRDAIESLPPSAGPGVEGPDPHHRARRHKQICIRRLQALKEGQSRDDLPEDLQLACHRGHEGHHDVYGRMWWDRPAPTLTSGCTNVTRGRFAHPTADRAITLREAMRLQTLPDITALRGTEGQMSQQVGNAVPTVLAEALADIVLEMEAEAVASSQRAVYA